MDTNEEKATIRSWTEGNIQNCIDNGYGHGLKRCHGLVAREMIEQSLDFPTQRELTQEMLGRDDVADSEVEDEDTQEKLTDLISAVVLDWKHRNPEFLAKIQSEA